MACVLIIEDDQSMRRALRLTFEKMNHEVLEAADGRSGLEVCQVRPIDLVITDLIMPGMEGVETIRAIRRLKKDLPIIAISGGGRGSPDNYLKIAQTFGVNQVFAKPFEFNDLATAAAGFLGGPPLPAA